MRARRSKARIAKVAGRHISAASTVEVYDALFRRLLLLLNQESDLTRGDVEAYRDTFEKLLASHERASKMVGPSDAAPEPVDPLTRARLLAAARSRLGVVPPQEDPNVETREAPPAAVHS